MFGFKKTVDQEQVQVWDHIVRWFEQGLVEVREAAYINEYTWEDKQWVIFYEETTTLAKKNLARVSKGKQPLAQLHVHDGAEGVRAFLIQLLAEQDEILRVSLFASVEGIAAGSRSHFRRNLDAAKVAGQNKKAIRQALEEGYWQHISGFDTLAESKTVHQDA